MPIGARIIGAVADYLELGAAATAMPDLDTVSQLLRASPAGAQVVDALLRVLESDRGDKTPATPTMLARRTSRAQGSQRSTTMTTTADAAADAARAARERRRKDPAQALSARARKAKENEPMLGDEPLKEALTFDDVLLVPGGARCCRATSTCARG